MAVTLVELLFVLLLKAVVTEWLELAMVAPATANAVALAAVVVPDVPVLDMAVAVGELPLAAVVAVPVPVLAVAVAELLLAADVAPVMLGLDVAVGELLLAAVEVVVPVLDMAVAVAELLLAAIVVVPVPVRCCW